MFKRIIMLGLLFMTNAWAMPDPLLVLDARNANGLPNKFRIDTELRAAGSAQFSERGLLTALDRIHTPKLIIIDLRQESHGFVNGNAISWYAKHDAINAGLTPEKIRAREVALLNSLAKNKYVTIYNILSKSEDGIIESAKPQDYAVHGVSSEEQIAHKHHLGYMRFYVQDFHAPDTEMVDKFVGLIRDLSQDEWLYFHCRAGSGRTTSFMVMYDMMRHAKTDSFEVIVARQHKLGGKDLTLLPAVGDYKYSAARERLEFLKKFYDYAKNSDAVFGTSWSEWLKDHP